MVLKNLTRCSGKLFNRDDIATGIPERTEISFLEPALPSAHAMSALHICIVYMTMQIKIQSCTNLPILLIVIEKISLLLINGLSSCGLSEFDHTQHRCFHFLNHKDHFICSHYCTVAFSFSTPWVQSYECYHSIQKEENAECVTFWYVHWMT